MAGAWLEVFKTGTHTSGNGVTKTYTDDDLNMIAKTYNDQKDHEAPLVIGHPSTDDPAYGWAKELKAAGSKLLAYVDQVSDSIVEAVGRGEYKKISIAMYPSGLLRHIGLLGAAPPAVKGLAPVQFAEELEFEEYIWATDETRMPIVARILSGLRDFFIEKFGLDATNKIIDKGDIAYLQEPASSQMIAVDNQQKIVPTENILNSPPGAISNYSEQNQQQEEEIMDELKAKIKTLEDALAAQATQFAEQMTEMQNGVKALTDIVSAKATEDANKTKLSAFETAKAEFAAFCEVLVKEGKILPAEKDSIVEEYADVLQAQETLTFADDAVKPTDKMKARLEKRAVIYKPTGITFADPSKAKPVKLDATVLPAEFAEMGDKVDAASLDVDRAIKEYAEANKVTYEEAAARYAAA